MTNMKTGGRRKGQKNLAISYNCHYGSCHLCKGRDCQHSCHNKTTELSNNVITDYGDHTV